MESGSPAADGGVASNYSAISSSAVAFAVNCSRSNFTSSDVLSCLRALTMEELLDALLSYALEVNNLAFQTFIPVVDGFFIPAPSSVLVRSGAFYRNVPTQSS
ncbi:hypothetical protein V1505DRAFT_381781 [Lipomyces doorenjongii]